MYGSVLDVALEVSILLAEVLATGLAIALGLSAEMASLSNLGAGNTLIGLWFAYMGTLALFVGVYLLGYRKLVRRVGRAYSSQ
jgi:hypothetical protein